MTDRREPIDRAIGRIADDATPTKEERELARSRLDAAMAREQPRATRQRIVVAAIALSVVLGFTWLQVFRASPLEAAVEQIARVIEASEPLSIAQGEFVYTTAETVSLAVLPAEAFAVAIDDPEVAYLLPSKREAWAGTDGVVRLSVFTGRPIFFDLEHEGAYYESSLDESDGVGQTSSSTIVSTPPDTEWPATIENLDEALRATVSHSRGIPDSVQYLESAMSILRESSASPRLRANTLRLVGQVSELTHERSGSQITLSIDYYDQDLDVDLRTEFVLDEVGNLLSETTTTRSDLPLLGAPVGTPLFAAEYSVPQLVEDFDQP